MGVVYSESTLRKLKILFTIPNFDTAGSGKALLNIATRLNKEKFTAEILSKHDKGEFFKKVFESGIKVHVFDYESPVRPILKGLLRAWKISRRLKRIKPDIIHSFHYSADYSEPLAAKMAGIKWVYTKKNMNWGGSSKNAWWLRTTLADHILLQNTDMYGFFTKFTKSKFSLVPRGVNTSEFLIEKNANKNLYKTTLGLKLGLNYIICVANLVPVKGVEILIEAFIEIKQADWGLLILGDDNSVYGKQLKSVANNSDLRDSIVFTGKVPNVKEYLSSSEIFILPTKNEGRREGSPVSMLEAMSMGLYVLGSNIPGIKDQLSDFPHLLFEAGNIEELKLKLVHVIALDSVERRNAGINLAEHVSSRYKIEQEVKRHEKVYSQILNN
jgi:glycosyltransferase involved in cell wall biosynthesis